MPLIMRVDQTRRSRCVPSFAHVGLFVLLVAGPLSVLALGLGEPIVKSHLGARLLVHIPLFLDDGDRADEIKVRLASAADRARFGNSSENFAVRMRLAVVASGPGGPLISVTSADSVREPALNFVVEVKTSSTRFMREYAVLLDPVNYRGTPKLASPGSLPRQSAPIAVAMPRPTADSSPTTEGDTYGPVAPGDTLSELGAKLRADSRVSVSQMSVALFQANPQAFADNDVNRLVAGAYLRVPNRDESTAMSSRAARERLYGRVRRPQTTAAVPVSPGAAPAMQAVDASPPAAVPPVTKSARAAADGPVTLEANAVKPNSEAPLEPEFRLSIVAADPLPDSQLESVISRLSGSKDIAVRDLVTRLESARQAGEELTRENLDLRGRITAADTRLTKLAAELRERTKRIAVVQMALEEKHAATLYNATATAAVVSPTVDTSLRKEQSERGPGTSSQLLGALAVLLGIWLLVRRYQR